MYLKQNLGGQFLGMIPNYYRLVSLYGSYRGNCPCETIKNDERNFYSFFTQKTILALVKLKLEFRFLLEQYQYPGCWMTLKLKHNTRLKESLQLIEIDLKQTAEKLTKLVRVKQLVSPINGRKLSLKSRLRCVYLHSLDGMRLLITKKNHSKDHVWKY